MTGITWLDISDDERDDAVFDEWECFDGYYGCPDTDDVPDAPDWHLAASYEWRRDSEGHNRLYLTGVGFLSD